MNFKIFLLIFSIFGIHQVNSLYFDILLERIELISYDKNFFEIRELKIGRFNKTIRAFYGDGDAKHVMNNSITVEVKVFKKQGEILRKKITLSLICHFQVVNID